MSYVPRHKPYAHQKKALAKAKGKRNFALCMAMRVGKSKTLLDKFGEWEINRQIDDLLIIAPGGVYHTWEKAIQDHVGDHLLHRLAVFTWVSGAGKKQERALETFLKIKDQPRAFLVNVEALSSVKRAREAVLEFAKQRKCLGAIDESTVCRNHGAERTKFLCFSLAPLLHARWILTGLVAPKNPLDLYYQYYFLDPDILGFRSFFGFRARYAVMKKIPVQNGRMVPIVVGFRDVDELYGKIEPHSFRVKLEDCYDMPQSVYMRRDVELTEEQEKHYREMKLFATTELKKGSHVTATQVITQIMRLHQILCGHTKDENGNVHFIKEKRTAALLEQLEEYDGKAIIWCSYDLDIRKVADALDKKYGKGSAAKFWGGNRSEREAEEARFLRDAACRFMVSTPAAGGRGRTWSNANLIIFYSNVNDLEQRAQAEERAKGVNKKVQIAYVDLVVPGTVDEKIIKALREKINMAAAIMNDGYKEWLI